jgi:hypothetical protein
LENVNQESPLVQQLISQLTEEAEQFNSTSKGVSQTYLDSLERIPKKKLKPTDQCAICGSNYLSDPYPLVVRLPCHTNHHFDLECIGPWLKLHSTCPMCRTDLTKKKEILKEEDDEDDYDDMIG